MRLWLSALVRLFRKGNSVRHFFAFAKLWLHAGHSVTVKLTVEINFDTSQPNCEFPHSWRGSRRTKIRGQRQRSLWARESRQNARLYTRTHIMVVKGVERRPKWMLESHWQTRLLGASLLRQIWSCTDSQTSFCIITALNRYKVPPTTMKHLKIHHFVYKIRTHLCLIHLFLYPLQFTHTPFPAGTMPPLSASATIMTTTPFPRGNYTSSSSSHFLNSTAPSYRG